MRHGFLVCAVLAALATTARAQLTICEETKTTGSDTAALDFFGSSMGFDGNLVVIGAPGHDEVGPSSGAAYVFDLDAEATWTELAELIPSDAGTSDAAGTSVSVSGSTVVVGAPGNGGNTGAVYVFVDGGGGWAEEAKLVHQQANLASLGYSVSIDGDTVIAGAPDETDSFATQGAAYVFVRSASSWTEEARLVAGDPGDFDYFGSAVAVDGDTAVVGAFLKNTQEGAAYVFVRSGGSWTQQAKLIPSSPDPDDFFGFSVDVDGDTAVVGAIYDESGSVDSGLAYVFVRSGTSWSEQTKLEISALTSDFDEAGWSVAIEGDRVAVGMPGYDNMDDEGGVAIFDRVGTQWTEQVILRASDMDDFDRLGESVGVSGDLFTGGAPGAEDAYAWKVLEPPSFYCTGKTTSLGCVPFMTVSGMASVSSGSPFQVRGNDHLPQESGVLLYSFKKANLNFHGGKLCVKPPFVRTPAKAAKNVASVNCQVPISGRLSRNFNATIQSGNDPLLTPGNTVYAQWRQRDPLDNHGDNFTDGVRFTICP